MIEIYGKKYDETYLDNLSIMKYNVEYRLLGSKQKEQIRDAYNFQMNQYKLIKKDKILGNRF